MSDIYDQQLCSFCKNNQGYAAFDDLPPVCWVCYTNWMINEKDKQNTEVTTQLLEDIYIQKTYIQELELENIRLRKLLRLDQLKQELHSDAEELKDTFKKAEADILNTPVAQGQPGRRKKRQKVTNTH